MFLNKKPVLGNRPPLPPLETYKGHSIRFDSELKRWVIEATGVVLEFRASGALTIPTTEYR